MAEQPDPPSVDPSNPDANTVEVKTLNELMNGIYVAVKRAQVEVQRGVDQKLDYYFPKNPHTALREPLLVEIPFPTVDDKTELRKIPLFALAPHHDLMIDQVNIRMKVSLLRALSPDDGTAARKVDIVATLAGPGADPDFMAEIEIKLKGTEPVEGIARINDAIVKRL
ncbi:MAG: DUF2589 domain-containing protein [Byssovorax sp.]